MAYVNIYLPHTWRSFPRRQFHKYIRTREKGALIVNVDYADEKSPNDPAFDWLSFAESQKTRDRTVQRSIAARCVIFSGARMFLRKSDFTFDPATRL